MFAPDTVNEAAQMNPNTLQYRTLRIEPQPTGHRQL